MLISFSPNVLTSRLNLKKVSFNKHKMKAKQMAIGTREYKTKAEVLITKDIPSSIIPVIWPSEVLLTIPCNALKQNKISQLVA